MIKNITVKGINPCSGCGMCVAVCPVSAIAMKLNIDGFYEPQIDNNICTNCGICKKSCYKYDGNIDIKTDENYTVYSAINKNNEELLNTTSGGVAIELSRECIRQGYKVIGVSYDYEKNIAMTQIANTEEDVEKFKGSKYFQSYTVEAFQVAVQDKSNQKYAVFGTPCQIYAFRKYLKTTNKEKQFILIDVFCHGCPSMNLWNKYLDYIKKKLNVTKFDYIQFRSKACDWHEYCFSFSKNNVNYDTKKTNNPFYLLFFSMNAFAKSCYTCKPRNTLEFTDLRLGDFWGYQYDTNKTGVSIVVPTTKKGDDLFISVKDKFFINKFELKNSVKGQSYRKFREENIDERKFILDLLKSNLTMDQVCKKYKKTLPLKTKIIFETKNFIKKLPTSVYFKIKNFVHKI